MDFQLYDYTENNFTNERLQQEIKNSWAIPSDGSMESNEEYFNWSNDLKLALSNPKYNNSTTTNNTETTDTVKYVNNSDLPLQKIDRKRKYFGGDTDNRKIQVVEALKDPLELSQNENLIANNKNTTEKRDGPRIAQWQVDDITDNLTAELNGTLTNLSADFGNGAYNVSDALLALPSLTVFKQEAPSPTSLDNAAGNKKTARSNQVVVPIVTTTSNDFPDSNNNQSSINTALQNLLDNSYNAIPSPIENAGIIDTPSPQDGNRNMVTSSDLSEDSRFQYVLAAATSIATKVNEDTLTYLNQGQSYEIKLKKLGDLSNYRGRILKSVIRICFYERRLQYMEKEQMSLWQSSRPGDRIIEVDVPLSYGLCEVTQPPSQLNAVHFLWDPTKEVGVYIKVNCISTEFTPKKHGGEKGVPFRIQVETYLNGDSVNPPKRLHAAACQIKVFKLKGADRKHKQDREKIMKRPQSEQEKYQPSYDCTVLNDIPNEAVVPVPLPALNSVTSTVQGPYSPEIVSPSRSNDFVQKNEECTNIVPNNATPPTSLLRSSSESNLPLNEAQGSEVNSHAITAETTVQQTAQWLSSNRFTAHLQTFAGFIGADMLRMSRDDLIQICGQADGIRLFNSLHSKSISPKLTIYVCRENSTVFHAVYLMSLKNTELCQKLSLLIGISKEQIRNIYCLGPHGIHVLMTDDYIKHVKEESMFSVDISSDNNGFVIVLKPINKQ